jgi:hypothetical protein
MKLTTLLAGAALVLTSSIITVVPAAAQRWEDCRERIYRAERHLDHMIDRYGNRSREAREARYDLERTRDWCYSHHRRDWDRDRRDGPPPPRDGWGH